MENSTIDKDQHKTFHNREIKEEDSVPGPSFELVGQADGEGNKEKEKSQGSKIQHGSRGKQQRERRKLREKRRSTGVVYLGNTESTGGSTTGEEDGKDVMGGETEKNTEHNEIMGKYNKYLFEFYLLHNSCHVSCQDRPWTSFDLSTRNKQ
jgi:hypothetical protein